MYTRYEVYMYVYIHPYVHFLSFYALVVVIDDWNFVTCTVSLKEEEDRVMCDCFVFVGVCEDVIHVYVHVQGTTIRYRYYLLCVLHVICI